MGKLIDLTGETFGRFKVISIAYRKNTKVYWKCQCECGNTKFVTSGALRQKHIISCGCYRNEISTKHGKSGVKEHATWMSMRRRCLNEKDHGYKKYGGRGIKICDRWVDSYENFLADMGPRPSAEHSIDRINNDEGYSKENCKWSTMVEQCNNRRSSVLIYYKEETKTLAQWCRELGLSYRTTHHRLRVANWSVERAFLSVRG